MQTSKLLEANPELENTMNAANSALFLLLSLVFGALCLVLLYGSVLGLATAALPITKVAVILIAASVSGCTAVGMFKALLQS